MKTKEERRNVPKSPHRIETPKDLPDLEMPVRREGGPKSLKPGTAKMTELPNTTAIALRSADSGHVTSLPGPSGIEKTGLCF